MDVNDAELLALAGDDSSDEGDTPAPATAKSVSPLLSTSTSQIHAKDASASISSSTPNASGKLPGARKAVKKTRKDDSEEEGEA